MTMAQAGMSKSQDETTGRSASPAGVITHVRDSDRRPRIWRPSFRIFAA
jgi:hypothetical protein